MRWCGIGGLDAGEYRCQEGLVVKDSTMCNVTGGPALPPSRPPSLPLPLPPSLPPALPPPLSPPLCMPTRFLTKMTRSYLLPVFRHFPAVFLAVLRLVVFERSSKRA